MKLIYTANARIPSEKAHPYQIVQMCEAFAGQGAEVTLLCANRRNPPELRTDDIWGHYGIARNFEARRVACLDVYPFAERLPGGLGLAWTRLAAQLATLTFNLALVWRLRGEREAVVYSRDPISLVLLAALWPRRAGRLFFEAHTYPATGIGLRLRRFLAGRIGGFVAVTDHLKARYEGLGVPADSLLVAHDGIRRARFDVEGGRAEWRARMGWPADAFIVGYMGRFQTLGMDKGLGELVEAVMTLAAEGAPGRVRLGLVGGPAETVEALREKLRAAGLPPDTVLYAGQVPPADVPGYLRAFDVCAMPFPWTEHFAYYASPMKLFEYMASGSPVVASDLPSTAEVIGDGRNGLLYPPGDGEALTDALRALRDDPTTGVRLAEQAARDVLDYTWEARACRILEMINSQLERD
jgi:glycosyltransferase involved in cell wall biosynthesis